MVGARQAIRILRHVCLLAAFAAAVHAEPKVSSLAEKPPAELAGGVAAQLTPAAKVSVGAATLDLWWVKALAADGPGWSNVESGTLVGALRVTGAFKEIRGKVVAPGVYTLRFGMQPQNGDHLGISPFREFLVLSPAAADTDPKVLGFDGVVALSKQVIGTSHPANLSLDPPEDAPGALLSSYKNESGHDGVVFEIPRQPAGTIKFGLIVSGLIVH
jgi:hypothetical protein